MKLGCIKHQIMRLKEVKAYVRTSEICCWEKLKWRCVSFLDVFNSKDHSHPFFNYSKCVCERIYMICFLGSLKYNTCLNIFTITSNIPFCGHIYAFYFFIGILSNQFKTLERHIITYILIVISSSHYLTSLFHI